MRRIVLNMQNYLFCDAIASTLQKDESDFSVSRAERPEEVLEMCRYIRPYAVLLEVTGSSPWLLKERLKMSAEIKEMLPSCKTVLCVDENAEKQIARDIQQAKKDKLIDQFIFGSISAAYLSAVMDTL